MFLEQVLALILVEAIMMMSLKKESENVVPRGYSLACGMLSALSALFYTYGAFEISYISCLVHKTLAYSVLNFAVFLCGKFFIQNRLSKRIDLAISKIMLLGNLCFWVYADQQWFFT